jgi:hypothetical protein
MNVLPVMYQPTYTHQLNYGAIPCIPLALFAFVFILYLSMYSLRVVPVSSVIPSATSKKLNIKDFFSGEVVRGQEEWLPVQLDSLSLAVSG